MSAPLNMRYFCYLRNQVYTKGHMCSYATQKNGHQRKTNESITFKSMLEQKRMQAKCSVLIQEPGNHYNAINYCRKFGAVNWKYSFSTEPLKHYTLVEYQSPVALEKLLNSAKHFRNNKRHAIDSRFLYFKSNKYTSNKLSAMRGNGSNEISGFSNSTMLEGITNSSNVSQQMDVLYSHMKMNDLCTKLRMFLCVSLEEMLQRLLPKCVIQPFGSCVTGFGKHNCDLDMNLEYEDKNNVQQHHDEGLLFLTKVQEEGNERQEMQQAVRTLGGIIKCFFPQFMNINRIAQARVPIIKFTHSSTMINCDLTIGNMSGYYMAELLWIFGSIDDRVKPLVFVIHQWAKEKEIIHDIAGPWISSYMLMLMTIFYLQNQSPQILPTVDHLQDLAGKTDRKSFNGNDCYFVSDWTKVNRSDNNSTKGELLSGFFKFYSEFNFNENGISIVDGCAFQKSEDQATSALYIVNPLEMDLNVGRIILESTLQDFQKKCTLALHELDSTTCADGARMSSSGTWGIAGLCCETKTELPEQCSNDQHLNVKMKSIF